MRRIIRTTGIAAAGFVLALGVAGATDRNDQAPESRAYLGFSFGGEKIAPRDFHYGLRLDHDARFVEGQPAPLMQFDFTRRGLYDARLNGLSVLKQRYRLQQSEEEATGGTSEEAPAEEAPAAEGEVAAAEGAAEEGFFSGMWSGVTGFFGGLFGGDEEEAAGEEAPADAPAETAEAPAEAAAEDVAEGLFMSYDIVDWGLLALGAVGVGLAASDVSGGEESPDTPGGGTGGTTGGSTTGGTTGCTTSVQTGQCIVVPGYAPNKWATPYDIGRQNPEYQKWLDGGTGQMGDLGGR